MGNSKIPAYGGDCCGRTSVPVARVMSAPIHDIDYAQLLNKPSIEGVTLVDDKTFDELGIDGYLEDVIDFATDEEIDELFA